MSTGAFRKPDPAGDGEKADHPDIDADDFVGTVAVVLVVGEIGKGAGDQGEGKYDRPAPALGPCALQGDRTEERADQPGHATPRQLRKFASERRYGRRDPQLRS